MKESVKEIPQGYKDSPLGIIPQDWEYTTIGHIAEVIGGGTPCTLEKAYWDGNINWFTPSEIGGKKYVSESKRKITIRGLQNSSAKVLPVNTILFTSRATIGEKAILKEEACTNQGFQSLVVKPEFDFRYVFHYLDLLIPNIKKKASGSTFPEISAKELKKTVFLLPPLAVQRKISSALDLFDEIIEKQALKIQKLELRKKGLMQQLLTGKKRLLGFAEPWQTVRLGDVFKERNEINCKNLPLLSIGIDGVYPQSESMKKDTSNEDKSKYKRICKNDIGYNTMRMWQGRSALSKMEGIVSPAYTIVVPQKTINPEFMAVYIKTPTAINLFWRHSQGLVKDTLNCKYSMFSKIIVSIPKLDEQTAIANILSEADKEITLEKNKLTKLQLEKKGLMQQLLTGKKIISA